MAEGGKKLAIIRDTVASMAKEGVSTLELDRLADSLISKSGGEASFKKVAGYRHATCISVNDEVVHGIPGSYVLRNGDLVGIDVGLYYQGFHTDTSISVMVGKPTNDVKKFWEVGKNTLIKTIKLVRAGNRVSDLSACMQKGIEGSGYSVVKALTGHGVGRELHEEPAIPCFVVGNPDNSPKLTLGMVVAVEVMYNAGGSDVVYKNDDGWTISTADGKISGLFEETVAVTSTGPQILTACND